MNWLCQRDNPESRLTGAASSCWILSWNSNMICSPSTCRATAVLLQMLDRGQQGAEERGSQAATSKSPAKKAACACMSRPPTLWTWPFLIIAITS